MSRNSLEDALGGAGLMRALAEAGRFRRAVRELARDEEEEGFWGQGEEDGVADADEPIRLAAQDATVFTSGGWRVEVSRRDGAAVATLTAGGGGASIRSGSTIVPLQQGVAVEVALEDGAQSIFLLDARGRQVELPRKD